jgi:two-component system, OmpR family, phosphate regulon sensor histidine kinase PhoR
MCIIFCVLLIAIIALLLVYIGRMRMLLMGLESAMRSGRRYLPECSVATLKRYGVYGIVHEANVLSEAQQQSSLHNNGYSNQLEAMLSAVQEVVVIFNTERVVEFANRSAERILSPGRSLKGIRLESVLRSLSLLELLEKSASADNQPAISQISIEHAGSLLWFEATCSPVNGIAAAGAWSTLLVLHDITKLKQLQVMQREFVANASHELRTPLTIIKGYAETLVDEAETMPTAARIRFLGKILNNAERLHLLVEDLLNLSRLESKPGQLKLEVQHMRPMIDGLIDDFRPRLKLHRQQIVLEYDTKLAKFAFDRFQINQVLDNLVVNALRYATNFEQIIISVELQANSNEVHCCVQDDGPGIPAGDLPHIFERFYRVDKGRSTERGGTGLGLSIVKNIIQQHGGSISAESQLGQGTSIRFSLPYRTHECFAEASQPADA